MPRKIRVLHVLHSFSHGGMENGIVNIINRSPGHIVHELCLMSRSDEFRKRLCREVVFHELNRHPGNDWRVILQLRELFRNRNVDVIHTRNWGAFDAVLAACLTVRPSLVHGEHGRDISDPGGQVYRRNLARRALAFRARKFVAVSADLHQWLRDIVRIPERKLLYIPNGVDTEMFCPGPDSKLRAELGIGQDEFVVGTVGRLDPIKNHVGVINAVDILGELSGRAHVRLVIVGDGPYRPQIEKALTASPTARPLLLGYRSDIERVYRIFDAFVLNSFAEGMSNTLLEAMASGVPVVCTRVGGNGELIGVGDRGVLVSPKDDAALAGSLDESLKKPKLARGYAERARKFVTECHSVERMTDDYVNLYESVA